MGFGLCAQMPAGRTVHYLSVENSFRSAVGSRQAFDVHRYKSPIKMRPIMLERLDLIERLGLRLRLVM